MKAQHLEYFYKLQAPLYNFMRQFILFNHKEGVEQLYLKKGQKVLDVACGTGLNLKHIVKHTGIDIYGLDYSQAMLNQARKSFPQVQFFQGDVTTWHTDIHFDSMICSYGITMIDKSPEGIANLVKYLKPEGKFVVVDFYHNRKKRGVWYTLNKRYLGMCGVYIEKDIAGMLRKHFGNVELIEKHGGYNAIWVATKPLSSKNSK